MARQVTVIERARLTRKRGGCVFSRCSLGIEPLPDSSAVPPRTPPPSEGLPSKIFLHDGGLRAGWRLLIYAAFVPGPGVGGGFGLRAAGSPRAGVFCPRPFFLPEAVRFYMNFSAPALCVR